MPGTRKPRVAQGRVALTLRGTGVNSGGAPEGTGRWIAVLTVMFAPVRKERTEAERILHFNAHAAATRPKPGGGGALGPEQIRGR